MKEATAIVQAGLQRGLRPQSNNPQGEQYLVRCMNLVPGQIGLEPVPLICNPLREKLPIQWPLPHVQFTHSSKFLTHPDGLAWLDEWWNANPIYNGEVESLFHVADYFQYAVLCNEELSLTVWGNQNIPQTKFVAKTCCDFKGQLIIGDCMVSAAEPVGGENIVAWSLVGSLDFVFEPNQTSGWAPMPWQGKVLAVRKLGDAIIVYGDNGIARLTPAADPVPAFGVTKIADYGIKSRDAIAGDDSLHAFVNTQGKLCTLVPLRALSTDGNAPTILGFEEFFESETDWVGSFDSLMTHFWFCNGTKTYVLSGQGLGETSYQTTGVQRLNGELFGVLWTDCCPTRCYVVTDTFTYGQPGNKTVSGLGIIGESHFPFVAGCYYKYGTEAEWPEDMKVVRPVNPQGWCWPGATARAFRFIVDTCYNADVRLNSLNVHLKFSDKRWIRGRVYAGTDGNSGDSE